MDDQDPRTLAPLLTGSDHPVFPRPTTSESSCWREVALSGDARRDFGSLVSHCGTPTGAIEYVKPSVGSLHVAKNKRDTFHLHVLGGLCYRIFGVADGNVKDLDVLIQRPGGALVGDDKTTGPVAIIDGEKAWCFETDGNLDFLVELDGEGAGHYVFGVWARPGKPR